MNLNNSSSMSMFSPSSMLMLPGVNIIKDISVHAKVRGWGQEGSEIPVKGDLILLVVITPLTSPWQEVWKWRIWMNYAIEGTQKIIHSFFFDDMQVSGAHIQIAGAGQKGKTKIKMKMRSAHLLLFSQVNTTLYRATCKPQLEEDPGNSIVIRKLWTQTVNKA